MEEALQEQDPQNIFDVYEECNPKVNPEFASTLPEVPKPSAGYAGGIVSSAIDGMRVAEAVLGGG